MNFKMKVFQFLFGGLFSALIYWAYDVSEGGSFDLKKFIVRIIIYGTAFSVRVLYSETNLDKRNRQKQMRVFNLR
jgi:hypothetical protein